MEGIFEALDCQRAQPTEMGMWYQVKSKNLDSPLVVCPKCFDKWLVPNDTMHIVLSGERYVEEARKCCMNDVFVRIWLQSCVSTQKSGSDVSDISHIEFFDDFKEICAQTVNCHGESEQDNVRKKWYTVESPISGKGISTLFCCEYCVRCFDLLSFNNAGKKDLTSNFIETSAPPAASHCSLQVPLDSTGSLKGPEFWSQYFLKAIAGIQKDSSRRFMSELAKIGLENSCPKAGTTTAIWFLPADTTRYEAIICEKCYYELVYPHLEQAHFLKAFVRYSAEGQRFECHFWSPKMRTSFMKAIKSNNLGTLSALTMIYFTRKDLMETKITALTTSMQNHNRAADMAQNTAESYMIMQLAANNSNSMARIISGSSYSDTSITTAYGTMIFQARCEHGEQLRLSAVEEMKIDIAKQEWEDWLNEEVI